MSEGIPKKNEPLATLAEQAVHELSPEQLETLEILFPDGVQQNNEEQLLYNQLVVEMATNPNVSIRDVRDAFLEKRKKIVEAGGLNPMDYVIEKDGTVSSPRKDEDTPTVH